jgi:hypothetical protein
MNTKQTKGTKGGKQREGGTRSPLRSLRLLGAGGRLGDASLPVLGEVMPKGAIAK